MKDLTKKEKKLLALAKSGGTDKELFILDQIEELEDKFDETIKEIKAGIPNLDEVLKAVRGKQGDKGDNPTKNELLSIIKPLIPEPIKGDDGYTPIKGKDYFDGAKGKDADNDKIIREVVSLIPTPKDGKDADEIEIIKKIETDLPKLGEAMRDGLEFLGDDDRLKIEAVKDLREELDELKKKKTQISGGIIGRDFIKDIDISGQLDGVTKTFNIQAVWNIISVHLSSFPYALRKTTDFTYTPTSITFTSQIDAASSLAEGQTCVLTVVSG